MSGTLCSQMISAREIRSSSRLRDAAAPWQAWTLSTELANARGARLEWIER